jgi:hypothetical protein
LSIAVSTLGRRDQGRDVLHLAAYDLRSRLGQGLRRCAVRIAGQRPHLPTAGEQIRRHDAALQAGRAHHHDGLSPVHDLS